MQLEDEAMHAKGTALGATGHRQLTSILYAMLARGAPTTVMKSLCAQERSPHAYIPRTPVIKNNPKSRWKDQEENQREVNGT
jgi:hypothetical protein